MLVPSQCPICHGVLLNSFKEKTSKRATYLEKICTEGYMRHPLHHFRWVSTEPDLDNVYYLHIQIETVIYDWHFGKRTLEISKTEGYHPIINLNVSSKEIPWIDIDLDNPFDCITRINTLLPII